MRAPPDELTGVVIGRADYGELDRIVRLLTPNHGVVAVFAPFARRPRSTAGGLDLGVRARLAARPGKGELWRLVDATIEDARVGLRRSYERMVMAGYSCELVGALAQAGHAEPRLYGLLETALLLLDATTEEPGPAFLAGIEAKALTFAGYTPRLDRCAVCGQSFEGGAPEVAAGPPVFDVRAGGARHLGCAPEVDAPAAGGSRPGTEPVSVALLAALEAARRRPLQESLDRGLPPGPPRILADLVEAHLGRPLLARAALGSGA